MKTLICTILIAATTALTALADGKPAAPAATPYPTPPAGWVCPMHGKNCPWVKHHRYCQYYDQHGYGSWRGGNCCDW